MRIAGDAGSHETKVLVPPRACVDRNVWPCLAAALLPPRRITDAARNQPEVSQTDRIERQAPRKQATETHHLKLVARSVKTRRTVTAQAALHCRCCQCHGASRSCANPPGNELNQQATSEHTTGWTRKTRQQRNMESDRSERTVHGRCELSPGSGARHRRSGQNDASREKGRFGQCQGLVAQRVTGEALG